MPRCDEKIQAVMAMHHIQDVDQTEPSQCEKTLFVVEGIRGQSLWLLLRLYHHILSLKNTAVISMMRTFLSLGFVGIALAGPSGLFESRQIQYVYPETDGPSTESCLSLRNSCNANTVDLSNFYSYIPCIMLTACLQDVENPAQVLQASGAPADQPRLTEEVGIITETRS